MSEASEWNFFENSRCPLEKISAFTIQYRNFFSNFCYHFLQNFTSQKMQLNIYSESLTKFPCTLHIIACNQKLGCGYNLFILRIIFLLTSEISISAVFYYYIKRGLFKVFLLEFFSDQYIIILSKKSISYKKFCLQILLGCMDVL